MHDDVLDTLIKAIEEVQKDYRHRALGTGVTQNEDLPTINYLVGGIDFGDRIIEEIKAIGKVIYEGDDDEEN